MTMKYVSTAELKAKLSKYLGEVREGSTVYVTHHQQPVALLSPVVAETKLTIRKPDQPVETLSRIKGFEIGKSIGSYFLYEDRERR